MHRHSGRLQTITSVSALVIVWTLLLSCLAEPARAQISQPAGQAAPADRDVAACLVAPRPNSLWSLAQCCSRNLRSDPDCRYYSAADEYIILKDNSRAKPAAYLIIPTVRVTGIEDKQIFTAPIVDFWEYGWQQAQRVVNRSAADTGLAINSMRGRTQNQLHIHIACVLPAVAQTLASNTLKIGTDPTTAVRLALGPSNHVYRVIEATGLAGADSPFDLVAAMPGARADMGYQSIAVVGSTTPGRYFVADTAAQGTNSGAAEELLDQTCGR